MEPRSVTIGDQDIRITRFRGLKAILAGALVARVMREVPQIQDRVNQFIKDYRENNKVKITPAMAKMPQFLVLGLGPEDFADQQFLELPDEPTGQQITVAVVPDLFDLAHKELIRFLALIAIPNSELEVADDADAVEEALDRKGKELFRAGDIDELLELAVVGWEVLQDQIMAKQARLGKLRSLPFLRTWLSTLAPTLEPEETPQTSPEEPPTSSTDSDLPIDGTEEQPSTESPGTSS